MVGLAVARSLARRGREVVVVEAEPAIGMGTSSRNSEVIHAGLYYPKGSLKARLCVEGKQALYAYCAERGIEHRNCGKLIVATTEQQLPALDDAIAKGRANGVDDLRLLSGAEARAMEPALACVAAVLSPSTGIIDSHGFMLALQGEAEDHGAVIAFSSPVLGGSVADGRLALEIGGAEPTSLSAAMVVNSAGLTAQRLAASLDGLPAEAIPPTYYAKGNYFTLAGRAPFGRLVYPVPEPGGLGVHLTLDLGGQARFGPDVEWIAEPDYHVDPRRSEKFYAAIRSYWPALPDGALQPGYAGIRPKLGPAGTAAADFVIQGPDGHGIPGLVNLYGIESPGLTSALAIGELVADML